ncbi:MAG: hypothetical protein KDC10_10210, partial [Calditrichaeota bacterium]|nr:hypothetical protein [Calditrichota bacterium]
MRAQPRILFVLACCIFWLNACDEPQEVTNGRTLRIVRLSADRDTLCIPRLGPFFGRVRLECEATGTASDSLSIRWTCTGGFFPYGDQGSSLVWQAPDTALTCMVRVAVSDGQQTAQAGLPIVVLGEDQLPDVPNPTAVFSLTPTLATTETLHTLNASASRPDPGVGSELQLRWDWEGDGIWDTPWSDEPILQHRFDRVDLHYIQLQTRNLRGMVAQTGRRLIVQSPAPLSTIDMIRVPAGQFFMGEGAGGHLVAIDHAFELGR